MDYDVKVDISGEDDAFGGRFQYAFKAGKHTPKNEQEEYALEKHVALGDVVRVKPTKAKKES